MSEKDRKRTLSESSGDEADLNKAARLDGSDSDSDSSSDSGSDSNSSSSSSSSSGEETQIKTKISPNSNSLPVSQDQTQTEESYNEHSQHYSTDENNLNYVSNPGEIDEDVEKNILAKKFDSDRRRQGSGLSLENPDEGDFNLGSIDILKQFLTSSVEDASCGPVDPVFVNHEDSQHATQMDSLVFEAVGEGLEGEDDMCEPRLDSVCNSNINSTEGSLVLGNDMEDGQLPSSPETGLSNAVEEMKFPEPVKAAYYIKSEDESEIDPDQSKKKKRLKKKVKKTKHNDLEKEDDDGDEESTHPKRQKHKKFKSGSPHPTNTKTNLLPEDDPVPLTTISNDISTLSVSSKCSKTVPDNTVVSSSPPVPSSKPVSPSPPPPAKLQDNPDVPYSNSNTSQEIPKSTQNEMQTTSNQEAPPLPKEEPITPPSLILAPPVSEPATSIVSNTTVLQPAPVSSPCGQNKGRRISLKDYKAKKEAEKQRRSQEGSGSESNSCPPSQNTSKETSPSPEPLKQKDLISSGSPTCKAKNVLSTSDVIPSTTESTLSNQEDSADISKVTEEAKDTASDDPLDMEPISDSEMDIGNIDEISDNIALRDFDVLDELEESENDTSKESGDDSDSLAEDEVDQMLEKDVTNTQGEAVEEIEPQEKLKKLVLEERGRNLFEVLPLGWVSVTHNSGIPLYLHRDTRVVSASRPYDIGNGSVRKHNLPVSAIPCFAYRYSSSPPATTECSTSAVPPSDSSNLATAVQPSCPYSSTSTISPVFSRENVSPDSTTDGTIPAATIPSAANAPPDATDISNIFPRAQIETIEESMKKSELTPEEITNYCKKIFVFKELEVMKFKTWKGRRAYYKQSAKKKMEKELSSRPTLPEGTKIITIPALEMSTIPGTEGDSAINQKVVKKSKKKWLINPVGKSVVCLLHEYVQQSLKMQPYYTFTELDNAATPYAATVHINKIEYGRGTGSSKKIAKSEAARRTLEMLIPEIKDKLPSMTGGDEVGDGPYLSFFDDIRVEDPRVADLCNRTGEPAPYQILVTCLQRNYGLGDTHIHQELKAVRNGKNEYTMRVDKREVAVICKNKKDGKQLAAAKLLQQLHPHISSWGSLLRMYGNRSIRTLKKKKEKETEVTGLQSRSSQSTVAPSMAILEKLKEEMRNLRTIKKSITPIGKFMLPLGSSQTGINTDHVDF